MTAETRSESVGDGGPDAAWSAGPAAVAAPAVRGDVFLLAGQFPGDDQETALRNAVTYARAAEGAGLNGVWLAEHHFITYGTCPSAVTLAGFILGATRRLRVGTAAAILSNRHPIALAEEAALLQAVGGGRFDLGVARGGPWVDLEVFGTGLRRFTDGFAEALDLLLAATSGGGDVGADGEFFSFRTVPVVPRVARPVPVSVAATSAPTVAAAAGRGLPLLLGMQDDDAAKAAMLEQYAAAARAAGRDPAAVDHASAHLALVADTTDEARAALRAGARGWLARTREYVRVDAAPAAPRDLDAYLEHLLDIHPIGTPEHCIARLRATVAATGVRRLLLAVEGTGRRERTLETIARLGAEVLPELAATADRATARPSVTGA